jgi:hypothetical protein
MLGRDGDGRTEVSKSTGNEASTDECLVLDVIPLSLWTKGYREVKR